MLGHSLSLAKRVLAKSIRKLSRYVLAVRRLIKEPGTSSNLRENSFKLAPRKPVVESEKAKILLLWPFIAIGGAETLMLELLTHPCLQEEFSYVNICLLDPALELGDMSEQFVEISSAFYGAENFQDSPDIIFQKIAQIIKEFDVEVLFIPNGTTFFYDYLVAFRKLFPRLLVVNQVFDHNEGWIRWYSKVDVNHIDYHVAPNLSVYEAYRNYDVPERDIRLIYHGIDFHAFARVKQDDLGERMKERLQIPPHKVVVSFVARMHPQKCPFDFLRVVDGMGGEDYHFVMVGDGPLFADVKRHAAARQYDNLTITGFYKPIEAIYSCTDILLVTSQYEGLPLVVLQALAAGIPVISTPVGAISEAVDHAQTGLMVSRVGAVSELQSSLKVLSSNLKTYQKNLMGTQDNLIEKFGIDAMSRQYLEIFKSSK